MIKLDLGSGLKTQDGFFGIDRRFLPGLALVADIEHPLPVKENSVDIILASHSLEHINNLQGLLKEIYRICRHGAQVCIVAPYSQQGLNFANPFHKQQFNEHTPRFWTTSRTAGVDSADYYHPHADGWGLAESDHSKAEVDFRCLRMEFFYFPEYRYLPPEKQREARKKYIDVCDQIMYHLIVVKTPTDKNQLQKLWEQNNYYEPPYVTARRLSEQTEVRSQASMEIHETAIAQIQASLQSREIELDQLRQELISNQRNLGKSQDQLADRERELTEAKETIRRIRGTIDSREAEWVQTRSVFQSRETELRSALDETKQNVIKAKESQNSLQIELSEHKNELEKAKTAFDQIEGELKSRQAEWEHIRTEFQSRESQLRNELQESRSHLARIQDANHNLQVTLTARDAELERITRSLNSRETDLEQIRIAFQSRENELHLKIEESQKTIADILRVQNSLHHEMAGRERAFGEAKEMLCQLQATLKDREIELQQARSREVELNAGFERARKDLFNGQVEYKGLRFQLEDREGQIKQIKETLGQLQTTLKGRETELQQARTIFHVRETKLQSELVKAEKIHNNLHLRLLECEEKLNQAFKQTHAAMENHGAQLQQAFTLFQSRETELRARLKDATTDLERTRLQLTTNEEDIKRTRDILIARDGELETVKTSLICSQTDLEQSRSVLHVRDRELAYLTNKGKIIAFELELFRHLKVIQWVNRFYPKPDLQNDIGPAFQQLKDDSFIFTKNMKGYRLQSSTNLQEVPYLEYSLDLSRPNLIGILLAPILDLPSQNGELAIEILSPSEAVVARSTVALDQIKEFAPTRFDFPPVQGTGQGRFRLRVLVHSADTHVRIFEWGKYGIFGLGPIQTRAFCGFLFKPDTAGDQPGE
jgi:hypothetical protein